MNNEEKILAAIDRLTSNGEKMMSMLGALASDVAGLKADVASLKTDVAGLKTDVATLKTDVKNINNAVIRIENDHGKKLEALFDAYALAGEKSTYLDPRVQKLEYEVADHAAKLKYLISDMRYRNDKKYGDILEK